MMDHKESLGPMKLTQLDLTSPEDFAQKLQSSKRRLEQGKDDLVTTFEPFYSL